MTQFDFICEEMKKHLDCARQNWLFGAGISIASKVPSIFLLTERVKAILDERGDRQKELYAAIIDNLPGQSHIEHHLSHLGDLIALADRSKDKRSAIGEKAFTKDEYEELYRNAISAIGTTVRYGYAKTVSEEFIGTAISPIVDIEQHIAFVKALFKNKANLLNRSFINIFTLNYDTLLEDALSIEKYNVIDGFSGGAIGFWNPKYEFQGNKVRDCRIYKLHGSVDWYRNADTSIVRNRYGTKYLSSLSNILIYPQATKYIETQKDPFAYLFSSFRNVLNLVEDNCLITCGYSFGDDHVNAEIELALKSPENRTTLVAFTNEKSAEDTIVHPILDKWLTDAAFNDRVFIASKKGLYNGGVTLIKPDLDGELNWWTFSGLTNFLNSGELK